MEWLALVASVFPLESAYSSPLGSSPAIQIQAIKAIIRKEVIQCERDKEIRGSRTVPIMKAKGENMRKFL
ncbi:hypothetical protein, partial [Bacillus sp. SIMBA_074]|uniref:hypothetical protein n=1 Tax=Bacillus sp. SIMBA_074 TaxID=3085812 RepID=UPI003979409C